METIVTAQSEARPVLSNDVQAAVRDIGNFFREGILGGPGISQGVTAEEVRGLQARCEATGEQLGTDLRTVQARSDEAIQRLEAMIASLWYEELH